ncbi:MAG: M23 family metallopeptidase [Deltaproteobacteria bacterium]|nr:M23 family metallopeptidase [Deltaproteobacteria bacterium]
MAGKNVKKRRAKKYSNLIFLISMTIFGCSIQTIDSFERSIFPVSCHYQLGRSFDPAKRHFGVDILVEKNCPVLAVQGGRVEFSGYIRGYGNTVVIKHKQFFSLYAHLSKAVVEKGEKVKRGSVIGYAGKTGRATAIHLHFETILADGSWARGKRVNPLNIFWEHKE